MRSTIRLLLKSPAFTITAILILGFGIGANTAIFSLINAIILKPLPYPESDRLVQICEPYQNQPHTGIDYPDYVDIAAAQHTFETIAVGTFHSLDLSGSGQPSHFAANLVSPSMFKVSGLSPILGRVFTEEEDIPNGPFVAVLSEHCWRTQFNADPGIIGKNITLSGHSFQVIGVVPIQVDDWGPPSADVYAPANTVAPLGFFPNDRGYPLALRDVHQFFCVGRLKPGVTVAQAQADLGTIHDNLLKRYPDTNRGYGLRIVPLLEAMLSNYATTTWCLGSAVACLLLIACANVGNLLFARGLQRRREMTIRSTLGASRWQLLGQLLLETTVLSFFAGVLGLLVAVSFADTIKTLCPPDLYRFHELRVDWTALVFVFGVILLTALLSGLLPALSLSRVALGPALKDRGSRVETGGPQRHRLQSVLGTAQVALACVLLIAAGLLIHSFEAAQNVSLGFNPHHLQTALVELTSAKYETDGVKTRAFWEALMQRIRRLPGVTAATMSDAPPLKFDNELLFTFTVDGQPDQDNGRQPVLTWQMIATDYFRTLGVPLLQGRDFSSGDTADKPSVTIIDTALAERYFPDRDPLGKKIRVTTSDGIRDCTVVGIVPHLAYKSAGHPENSFQAYFPNSQWNYDDEYLIVRSDLDPGVLIPAIRTTVASVDSGVPISDVHTYDDLVAEKFITRRLSALLVTLFSCAALFLSAIGLYGVLAYSVGQRTREIGIRIALGARVNNIFRLIAAQGFKILWVGLLLGVGAALAAGRLMEGLLYGVAPADPIAIGGSVLLLSIATMLAGLVPALRATRVKPITALRE